MSAIGVSQLLIYGLVLGGVWWLYARWWSRRDARARELLASSIEAGLDEPASLHPAIDPATCVGCAACVEACPEEDVLGIVRGKAALVNAASCIGHGACATACPMDAITLVFGSEKRGVELPVVGANFETNVPGLFIAGELGGMGLIRNAIEQGRQAVDALRARARADGAVDLLIVGAGPAGLSAALRAHELRLRYVAIEQESLGGTVAHYPRGKIVMTQPATLPLYGKVRLGETSKEKLLDLFSSVVKRTGVVIRYGERLERVRREGEDFVVETSRATHRAGALLLAIGRRGTPRKLGVPGEELAKVVYRLIEPEQYRGQHVLVVGGGDSAIEAAVALAAEPETAITLSYRGESFARAKPKNRAALERAQSENGLRVLLPSTVTEILPDRVRIQDGAELRELRNDAVIVCAGGTLPNELLGSLGVAMDVKHGRA